jgi:hypothetical protein
LKAHLEAAAVEVARLHAGGFSGIRIKPCLFAPGERMTGATGMAAVRACAERGMPVSLLTSTPPELEHIEASHRWRDDEVIFMPSRVFRQWFFV